MTTLNLIAAIIIIAAIATIIGIRIYKGRNSNEPFTIDTFIDTYGDQIINCLQDVIQILEINMKYYESKVEYENAIISCTIDALKENSIGFGIPANIVNIFDTAALTSIIRTVMENSKCDTFSVLTKESVEENKGIIDNEVIKYFETQGYITSAEPTSEE